ncbi:MAG: response regulator [Thermoguttaceae bacterium]
MTSPPIRILLVEDNPPDAVLLKYALTEATGDAFQVTDAQLMADAVQHLATESFDAILLDLSLPDSNGIATVEQASAAAPNIPILVMTGLEDEAMAVQAVRKGAQDYLIKGRTDGWLLSRAIRYALERKQMEQELKALNETLEQRVAERTAVATRRAAQLQALASELTRTEQRERRRLAQLLHDDLQQLLYAARLNLGSLQSRAEDESTQELIGRVDELLSQSIARSRSLTVQLSPPVLYDAGLSAALEWLGRYVQETLGLAVDVTAATAAEPESEDLRILLFDATRELLFNVAKHAGTRRACVATSIPVAGRLELVVADDGAGFDPARSRADNNTGGGFGLLSIRERLELLGGQMSIDAAVGHGTRVTIRVPCRPNQGVVNENQGGSVAVAASASCR